MGWLVVFNVIARRWFWYLVKQLVQNASIPLPHRIHVARYSFINHLKKRRKTTMSVIGLKSREVGKCPPISFQNWTAVRVLATCLPPTSKYLQFPPQEKILSSARVSRTSRDPNRYPLFSFQFAPKYFPSPHPTSAGVRSVFLLSLVSCSYHGLCLFSLS